MLKSRHQFASWLQPTDGDQQTAAGVLGSVYLLSWRLWSPQTLSPAPPPPPPPPHRKAPVEPQAQQPHGPSTAADDGGRSAYGSVDSAVCSGGGAAALLQGLHAVKSEAAADATRVRLSN